ncbi:MAG: bifunctional nuclease family protein [Acidobacteriota bacterium]
MTTTDEPVLMEVKGLMMDPKSNVPIVILRSEEQSKMLPIWIGIFEANAIAVNLEGIQPPRPMTHDLFLNLIEAVKYEVNQILIHDLVDNTFFAQIFLKADGEDLVVDSRPSDAIALALRAKAPILVSQAVLQKAKIDEITERSLDKDKLKKWLEEIDPEDLGKYTM